MKRINLIQSQLKSCPLSNNNTLTITDNRTGIKINLKKFIYSKNFIKILT